MQLPTRVGGGIKLCTSVQGVETIPFCHTLFGLFKASLVSWYGAPVWI